MRVVINANKEVDSLVAEGRYEEAAKAAEMAEDYLRAAELYEQIWRFSAAARCSAMGGLLQRALGNALEGKDYSAADSYAQTLQAQGEEGKRQALQTFKSRRHYAKAARLAEELGDGEEAASLYQQGHLDLEAARVLVALHRDRDAGRILERVVQNADPGDERSRANLQLGLILAKLMQHEAAVRCLQDAAHSEACRAIAKRALVIELAALGLRDAARDALLDLRTHEPEIGADLDAFIREHRTKVVPNLSPKSSRVIGGRYRLEALLGSGGTGRVFQAHDEVSSKAVAVKLLATSHSQGDETYQRFARETKVAASLRHPNIVEVYDFSAELGFLVMELMIGGSLEAQLKEKLAPTTARRMCLDIITGLELAHQRGIIHRDLKPANIFFDARGTAKLGDFGVAHLLDLGQTQTGGLIGTLAYMSPEQITGAPLTIAADLYGLGVTLFEALTGRLPFRGPDFVAQHLGEDIPLASVVSDVDPVWDPIISCLLAKNPAERYDSIDALRQDLLGLKLSDESGPLLMHRLKGRPARASAGIPAQAAAKDEASADGERYAFERSLGETSQSTLSRAVDTVLDRSVIIERFADDLSDEQERRLFALARGGGPFLQRVLSYEKKERKAIFEAPTGRPLADLAEPMSVRLAVRLLKQLARAVAPLHTHDRAHGGLGGTTVLLDERGHPTVLVCGLESLTSQAQASNDLEAIMELVSEAVSDATELAPSAESLELSGCAKLIDALLGPGSSLRHAELLEMPVSSGAELYDLADAIEFVLLKSRSRGAA